jgi:hypothetical protein
MSDEPKKSRAWIGWTLVTVLIAYPLSTGPVLFLTGTCDYVIYRPLLSCPGFAAFFLGCGAFWSILCHSIFR